MEEENGCLVYLANLSRNLNHQDLSQIIQQRLSGLIHLTVAWNDGEMPPEGFGFAVFEQPQQAALAIRELNRYVINGTRMHADSQPRIVIKNLQWRITEPELMVEFQGFNPLNCRIPLNSLGNSRGFSIMTFSTLTHAQNAILGMHGRVIRGREIECKFDASSPELYNIELPTPRPFEAGDGQLVLVWDLLPRQNESFLYAIFSNYGPIFFVKMVQSPTGRRAVIKFRNANHAVLAVNDMLTRNLPFNVALS